MQADPDFLATVQNILECYRLRFPDAHIHQSSMFDLQKTNSPKANSSMNPSFYERQGSPRLLGKLLYSGGRLCLPRRPACSARMEICRQPCWKRDHACNQQVSFFGGNFSPQGAGDGTEVGTDVKHIRSQSTDA